MFEDSRVVISLRGFFVDVCYVVLSQECCRTCQYNRLYRMLWNDFNTTLNLDYVVVITLLILTCITNSSIITIINVFVMKNLILSSLLPLWLVFLFFLLILRYLFVIVFFSQCCYIYQANVATIVSLVNFVIYTFAFHLREFQPLKFSLN